MLSYRQDGGGEGNKGREKMENKLDKYVAKQIILAQIASDGGKQNSDILSTISFIMPISKSYYKKAYDTKDHCIKNAIKAIQKNPNTGFYYHVTVDRTLRNNRHCFIIYFNFKINNEAHQISFHSFGNFWHYINKQCPTRWKKVTSSREATCILAYYVFTQSDKKVLDI